MQDAWLPETFLQYPGIESVSAVSNIPGARVNTNSMHLADLSVQIDAYEISVDENYIETLGLKLSDGRGFMKGMGSGKGGNLKVSPKCHKRRKRAS